MRYDNRVKQPLVSIIVPVYNAAAHLERCVESVLAQTYPYIELILVNDGSTDGSDRLCDRLAARDTRIRALHGANKGQTHARTRGLKVAKGDYIHFVDADDWLALDMTEIMVGEAEKHTADIVTCGAAFHYANHHVPVGQRVPLGVYDKTRMKKELYPKMLYSGQFFYFGIYAAMWNKLFRREIIGPNILAVDEAIKIGEDGVATYGAFLDAKKIVVIENHLYQYRDNNDSITRTYCKEQFDNALLLIEALRKLSDRKAVYDLDIQIDYYFMYNVRSILLEEFYYRHKKPLGKRLGYLRGIVQNPDVIAAAARIDISHGFTAAQTRFFTLLRSGNFTKLIAATMHEAYRMRSRKLIRKALGRY